MAFVAIFRFALLDLSHHWRLGIAMVLLVTVPLVNFLVLDGYKSALADQISHLPSDYLVVQELDSVGEVSGSRLSPQVGRFLTQQGYLPIPEIHALTGTNFEDIVLLRGIDLSQYKLITDFELIDGEELSPGSTPRTVMLGEVLARRLGSIPGQDVLLRGRMFRVSGIFRTRTYVDNEAWVSIADAQRLLGWEDDVSIYVIPAAGTIKAGDRVAENAIAIQRGLPVQQNLQTIQPLFRLFSWVARLLGFASGLGLANILLRLAWNRRRELAILRSLGYGAYSLLTYLFGQSVLITSVSVGLAWLCAEIIFWVVPVNVGGLALSPHLDRSILVINLAWCGLIALLGALIPTIWLARQNPAQLLRQE